MIRLFETNNSEIAPNKHLKFNNNTITPISTKSEVYIIPGNDKKAKFEYFNFEIAHGICSPDINCFLPYGVCLDQNSCLCLPEYANIYIKAESLKHVSCSYKKKKLVIAGLLELFLPLSLGHFYVQQVQLGLLKLAYNLFVYSFCCVLFAKSSEVSNNLIVICLVLSCLIPIWNVADMFLFFTGYYRDGNGVPLN